MAFDTALARQMERLSQSLGSVHAGPPYAVSLTTDKETNIIVVDCARLFLDMAAAILDLFETGKGAIVRAASLMIRRILDVALTAKAAGRFMKL